MNYQVLARKWRPQTFSNVVGQEHVLTTIKNSLSLGRIHHAWIFSGSRGTGKTSIARLLAKSLSCENGISANTCGMCKNCLEIEQGRFVDLIEIDAASRTKIEDTLDMLNNVQYSPVRGRFKIYLIDEVHMLSRHSLNALLKTLEEPPTHVKFLLATTDPQKLPITILSRCLQFHLRILDVEQILKRIEYILTEEQIIYDVHAIRLLARAATGSLRDALSLTDQAIAFGNGILTVKIVNNMLGMSNNNQALSLIEAIVEANSERVMMLVNDAASCGIEWEMLLIEMQSLLHYIAMIQLSSMFLDKSMEDIEHRIRKLASIISPSDVQFYYQILLIGRKELPFAPDRRMGIEMTFLRALTFHQKKIGSSTNKIESCSVTLKKRTPIEKTVSSKSKCSQQSIILKKQSILPLSPLSEITRQTLSARKYLQRSQEINTFEKKNRLLESKTQFISKIKIDPISEKSYAQEKISSMKKKQKMSVEKEKYDQKFASCSEEQRMEVSISNIALKKLLENKNTSEELTKKITQEVIMRDSWAAEISKLRLSKIARQVALNSWKEQKGNQIYLHLRSDKYHLNSPEVMQELSNTLEKLQGISVELSIIKDEDNNPEMRTPLEWKKIICQEKFQKAYKKIINNNHIQTIQRIFDAKIDEDGTYF